LAKIVSGAYTNKTTKYAGNYIYEDRTTIIYGGSVTTSELQFFNHPEGYVQNNNGIFNYVYQYKDHLGNVRLSYADVSTTSTPVLEIIEESNYYPFGLKHKGYNNVVNGVEHKYETFNGKELEESLGLNWHDYGARRYDASLGRWMSSDPLAEKYETSSPYTYVLNNPINAVDPDGRLVIFVNGLLFDQALAHKSSGILGKGGFSSHYEYPPPRNYSRNQEPSMFGKQVDYWGNIDNAIANYYGDDLASQSLYYNATSNFGSQGGDRYKEGQVSGLELIESLKNGTIELENEETIKIVGHSQGAAFAAGMLSALMESEYASRVEAGIYLSPHQPGSFEHPGGVFGAQFSTRTDKVSSGQFKNGFTADLIHDFNGGSDLKLIEGVNFMYTRPSSNSSLGGHEVDTWENILQQISDFLNSDND
jgi:RHS repeat-associated protein